MSDAKRHGAAAPDRSHAAAANFRAILNALARPGRIYTAAPFRPAPAPLSPAAAALLTTLADMDAPYWLAPSLSDGALDAYARFETSAAPSRAAETADFLFGEWSELAPMAERGALRVGTAEYPDRSATLVVSVDRLAEAHAGEGAFRVTGPGVEDAHIFHAGSIADEESFLNFTAQNAARFPLGVDILLTSGSKLVGLPRTARIEREG